MKEVFSTAAAIAMLCFFTACKDSTTTTGTTANSQNEQNLANNRKVYKAIETGDARTLDSFIAGNAIDHQGPNGMDIKGGDSVKHMLLDIHNHLKNAKYDVIAEAANGDYIFTMVQISGTAADATWGMPAGTKINEKGVDVVKIKDGKMLEHWGFLDPNEMMKHLKEMPAMNKK